MPTDTPAPEAAAPEPAPAAPEAPAAEAPEQTQPADNPLDTFIIDLQGKNNRKKIETLANALNKLFPADSDVRIRNNFYLLLRQLANRKIISEPQQTEQ